VLILELSVLVATLLCAGLGAWSIYWAKSEATDRRSIWGHSLFVLTLLALGATGLVAALCRSAGLPPLGLVAGLLVVGMLWDGSPHVSARHSPD
jgi:hypothetical protein